MRPDGLVTMLSGNVSIYRNGHDAKTKVSSEINKKKLAMRLAKRLP